jgi:hypothetical protein
MINDIWGILTKDSLVNEVIMIRNTNTPSEYKRIIHKKYWDKIVI